MTHTVYRIPQEQIGRRKTVQNTRCSIRDTGSRGFSLIELLVVTAIFVILTGVVLANNTRFGNIIILQNLAHDIALSIRQAQVYGIAVRRCDASNPLNTVCNLLQEAERFEVAYGVHFCPQGSSGCVNPSAFELFVDANRSGTYDSGETVLSNTIADGYRIDSICLTPASGGEQCINDPLNIVFIRPEPDACINGSFVDGDCISTWIRASITVKSNRDDAVEVLVERTGQISVQ